MVVRSSWRQSGGNHEDVFVVAEEGVEVGEEDDWCIGSELWVQIFSNGFDRELIKLS